MIRKTLLLLFIIFLSFENINSIKSIYKSLDPKSLSQLLAFYELYPETEEGKTALNQAFSLLYPENKKAKNFSPSIPLDFHFFISMINNEEVKKISFTKDEYIFIEKASNSLANRHLKGHLVEKIEDLNFLKNEEIDLSRALFLLEMGEEKIETIKYYETCLDLMALQIAINILPKATMQDKINAINDFIFFQMQFRFPPHSLYAKDIDTYSFLPSVMEKRQGVCLGVSVLYICLSQRLGIPLQAVTPPGHIFVRGFDKNLNRYINIETTMRGVDISDDNYLSLEYPSLQTRNNKEVIGLVFINQAAAFWQNDNHEKAIIFYKKALNYLPDDPLVLELLGYNYLFTGKEKEATTALKKALSLNEKKKNSLIEDFFAKKTNAEGIKAIFMPVSNSRESILEKQSRLKKTIKKYPFFRAGIFQLATTYLQLERTKEAHKWLNKLLSIENEDPTVNYYQTLISMERYDFATAWKCYFQLEKLLKDKQVELKKLISLKQKLKRACHPPEKTTK